MFYVAGKQRGLYVGEIGSSERSFLFDPDPSLPAGAAATPGVYAPSGHLLYVRDRVLMARPFDASSRSLQGEAFKLADTVDYTPPGQAAFAVAGSVLVYRPRQHLALGVADVDGSRRRRRRRRSPRRPAAFRQMSLSADGRTAAVERRDAQGLSSVWTIDLESGATVRVPGDYWSGSPVWSARRRRARLQHRHRLAAEHRRSARSRRRRRAARHQVRRDSVSGRVHALTRARCCFARSRTTPAGICSRCPLEGGSPQRLLQTPADENEMSLSPDGRFLAYTSNESGRTEVYVSRFPEMSNRVAGVFGRRPAADVARRRTRAVLTSRPEAG